MKTGGRLVFSLFLVVFIVGFGSANTHTSTADLQPEWSVPGVENNYTVKICNSGTSEDSVDEIRIYKNELYGGFEDKSACKEKEGWELQFIDTKKACHYIAKGSSYYIDLGECADFEFHATAPKEDPLECLLYWKFETRDVDEVWHTIYDTTSIDSEAPVTTKEYGKPFYFDEIYDWISTSTPITLTAQDMSIECGIGVDDIYWRNTLLQIDEQMCIAKCSYEGSGSWNAVDGNIVTFNKDEESCHLIEFYAVDKLGNKEETKKQCVFVDNTPPEVEKDVGEPSADETNEEEIGDGKVSWTTSQYHSGTSSVELSVLDGTKDWAGIDIPVDIALQDITSLTFWELIKQYNPNGWSVNVILGVDTDGDGVFESDLDAWHIGSLQHNPSALGDDTFIEMDGKWFGNPNEDLSTYGHPPIGVWLSTDAYNTAQWWTTNANKDGLSLDCYETLPNIFSQGCLDKPATLNPTDKVKLIKLQIGGSGSWKNEKALVDELSLNSNVILNDITPDRFTWVNSDTKITFTCSDPEPHPSGNEELCFKVSYDRPEYPTYITKQYCDKYKETMQGEWCCISSTPQSRFIFDFDEKSFHDLEYYCRDAVEKKSETYIQYYKVITPPVITKAMIGEDNLGDCPPDPEPSDDVCYVRDGGGNGVSISVAEGDGTACSIGTVECRYELWWKTSLDMCNKKLGLEHLYNEQTDQCFVEGGPFDKIDGTERKDIYFHEDSTHTLKTWCKYALGEVYDEEEFLVDSTPPVTTKRYGNPHYPVNLVDLEVLGNGIASWTTEQHSLGSHSAKLVLPDNALGTDFAGVDSFFDIFIELDDITSLTYDRKVTEFNKGWSPIVILGIDADEDGIFEAHPLEWEASLSAGSVNPSLLGDDSFIQCEAQEGLGKADDSFVNVNAYTTFKCYTPNVAGNGYEAPYDLLSYFKSNTVGRVEKDDPVAMVKIELGGNPATQDNEIAYVDNVRLNGNVIIDEYPVTWITPQTPITLTATDNKVGVDKKYYRITWLESNEACLNDLVCQQQTGILEFIPYENPFPILQESCHLIEYYSVDKLGNTEQVKRQCVFVDNTPPTPLKTVGDPKTIWDGADAKFYDIDELCGDEIDCWKVTLDTPISMTCEDPIPHPVDHEKICFNVELDGEDATEIYCNEYDNEEYDTEYNESGDGFCCLDQTIKDFKFLESSEHNLKFYCEDALGNKGPEDEEKFKVEGNDFRIKLNKKWNLISVPVVLLNDDPAEVFEGLECVDSIWTYDGEGWYVYTPDDAPDNLKIKPGYGYWVLVKENCENPELVIGGSLLSPGRTPPSRNLVPGWNLIGYYGMENPEDSEEGIIQEYDGPDGEGYHAYCSLYSLVNTNALIPTKRWSSLYGYWELDEPQFEPYGMCDRLDPGAGYWIHMPADMEQYSYAPSTGCPTILWDLMCGGPY